MKKKKTYIPLPEGCEAFRGSWILGLTVTFGGDRAGLSGYIHSRFRLCRPERA